MWILYSRIPTHLRICLKMPYRKYHVEKNRVSPALLSKLVGLKPKVSRSVFKQQNVLFKMSSSTWMKKCAAILQEAGYSSKYLRDHLFLLSFPPFFLKNSLFISQEYACYNDQIGFTIGEFNRFLDLSISTLKKRKVVPTRVDVLDSFLLYLKIPKSECDVEIEESETVREIYWKFFAFFLRRELQFDAEAVNKVKCEDYLISFRLLRENLYLLRKTFGFSIENILQMPFLLRTDSENTISILRSARGVNLKENIRTHPRLLTVPSENIQIVNRFLKDNGMDFNLLLNDPEVLKLDINKLMYRLTKLVYSPSLSVFKDHPRISELLRLTGMASERLSIMKQRNMNCYDMNLLTCDSHRFVKHIEIGVDKNDGDDAAIIISKKLDRPFDEVRRQLRKNAGFRYVALPTVRNNSEFLFELGFTKDDIFRSVQILLYPRFLIEDKLNEVVMNSVVVNDSIEFQVLKREYFLPLALYFIEKDFRFQDSGVYRKDNFENCKNDEFSGKFLSES